MNNSSLSTLSTKAGLVIASCLIFAGLILVSIVSGASAYPAGGAPGGASTATPTGTPACTTYDAMLTGSATIVPGTIDTGNHCNSCNTSVTLPFSVTLYGQTFNTAEVGANGYLAFGIPDNSSHIDCFPSDRFITYAILPFWAFQATDAPGKGIYTLLSGTAPNRTFYIEWRNCVTLFGSGCIADGDANYEVILREKQNSFEVVYGAMGSATADKGLRGIARNNLLYTQFSCGTGATSGDRLTYTEVSAACPTSTPVTPTVTSTPTQPPCVPQWRAVPRPGSNPLSGLSAPAPNDAWAVGQDGTLHWNGSAWSILDPRAFSDISASLTGSAWAVSASSIARWTGSSWTDVPLPSPTPTGWAFYYYAVAARSDTDVWVVGGAVAPNKGPRPALVLHFTNGAWVQVAAGGPGKQEEKSRGHDPAGAYVPPSDVLYDVAIQGANDMVAVGAHTDENFGPTRPIATGHCPAASCPTPVAVDNNSVFYGVATAGPDDVWAVGRNNQYHSLVQHWNGTAWSVVSAPNVGPLERVIAPAPNDVWAVASQYAGGIIHWNGTAWSTVPSPSGASSVDASSSNDVWAVGSSILHYPSAQVFSDVPAGNPFYPYIQCMLCHGIISGYPDNTFRPNNNVTRGQLAKIVSNAADFHDPQSVQIFEDVPPGSTFFDYIGRLTSRGYMSGYPCGGPGEPCGVGNRPYFRPNNNATRGQISKIVSNAANLSGPPGAQIFEDVPPGSTYYDYIQRLASRGYMSGYPCGGPGEPCGVGNRPYFRPNNNATRGQTSKIVSKTFFPECNPLIRAMAR